MPKVYAVRDRKASIFHRPFFERDHVMAVRGFEDACKDEKSPFAKWPGDYELLYMGEFAENTGKFELLDLPVVMADPMQFLSGQKPA